MTPDELDAIEARANAATAGPWEALPPTAYNNGPGFEMWTVGSADDDGGGNRCELVAKVCPWDHHRATATFIAAARTDVPALVAEVRRLQEESTALRQRYNAVAMELAAMADDKVTVPRLSGEARAHVNTLEALFANAEERGINWTLSHSTSDNGEKNVGPHVFIITFDDYVDVSPLALSLCPVADLSGFGGEAAYRHMKPSSELAAYLATHTPGPFKPVPHYNPDGHMIEWYWLENPAYAVPVIVDGEEVGCLMRCQTTEEVVGVKVFRGVGDAKRHGADEERRRIEELT